MVLFGDTNPCDATAYTYERISGLLIWDGPFWPAEMARLARAISGPPRREHASPRYITLIY